MVPPSALAEHLHLHVRARLALGDTPCAALRASFASVDAQVCATGQADYCGATCVAALVRRTPQGGRSVHTANCGDARCLLVVFGPPLQCEALSFDHVPSVSSEQERITAAGGTVARGRVMGVLAVSRAIGDERLKPYVCAQPDSANATLEPGQRAALLLFCDGVSGVMTDVEVTKHVGAHHRALSAQAQAPQAGDQLAQALAASLVQEALLRGTRDNVTAVVVLL